MAINEELKEGNQENKLPNYFVLIFPLIGMFISLLSFLPTGFPKADPISIGTLSMSLYIFGGLFIFTISIFITILGMKVISLNGWNLLDKWEQENPGITPLYYTNNYKNLFKDELPSKTDLVMALLIISLIVDLFALIPTIILYYFYDDTISRKHELLVLLVFIPIPFLFLIKAFYALSDMIGMIGIYHSEKRITIVSGVTFKAVARRGYTRKKLQHMWIKEKRSRGYGLSRHISYELRVGTSIWSRLIIVKDKSLEKIKILKETIESMLEIHINE